MFQKFFVKTLTLFIRVYQKILSPDQSFWGKKMRLRVCIFDPTCSEYSIQALRKYGVLKGFWLSLKRILRCHPWSKGGEDKVP